jgi:glycosyltransferase involved in cell wall biosynthesis
MDLYIWREPEDVELAIKTMLEQTPQGLATRDKIEIVGLVVFRFAIARLGLGIDLNRFDPSRNSSETLSVSRAGLHIPESRKVLLFAGGITPDKDIKELVSAFADVLNKLLGLLNYREGFATVVMEAAAMGAPTIATDIYGLSDAIVDGGTGVLVPVRDAVAVEKSNLSTLNNVPLVSAMGAAARDRALNDFGANNCSELSINKHKDFSN